MPSSLQSSAASTAAEGRTVLFPTEFIPLAARRRAARTSTSGRRQWLVQTRGPLGRRRRMVEFLPQQAQVTMGSGEACRCQVNHAAVSRLHAALVRRAHRGVYLIDLSSREGTFLNGERVTDEVLLMDGDRISLGKKVEFEYLDGKRPESTVRRWARKVWFAASGITPIFA